MINLSKKLKLGFNLQAFKSNMFSLSKRNISLLQGNKW